MREHDREIEQLGAQVVVVSFASPAQLKQFARRLGHPYLWLADAERSLYRRLGLGRRGIARIVPGRVLLEYVRLALRGKLWRPEQTDMAQMGGDWVFAADGDLFLDHPSQASDDRPAPEEVIAALRRAATR